MSRPPGSQGSAGFEARPRPAVMRSVLPHKQPSGPLRKKRSLSPEGQWSAAAGCCFRIRRRAVPRQGPFPLAGGEAGSALPSPEIRCGHAPPSPQRPDPDHFPPGLPAAGCCKSCVSYRSGHASDPSSAAASRPGVPLLPSFPSPAGSGPAFQPPPYG